MFANKIKSLREASGLSQKELAEKVGVCQQAVAGWESGRNSPKADRIPSLAKALNCSPAELFREVA